MTSNVALVWIVAAALIFGAAAPAIAQQTPAGEVVMAWHVTIAPAAGLIVPKKYVEQVGEDGFRKHPIGAGPYKFVSHLPGVEVVLEAYTGYWRHTPYVKRWVMKSVSDGGTRLAMLKTGEADLGVAYDGPEAEEIRRNPKFQLVASKHASINWLEFAEQWDPKSPWH